jgi:cytochrome c-type biogenesis protein
MLFILLGIYLLGLRLHHLLNSMPFSLVAFYLKQDKKKYSHRRNPVIKAYSLGTLFGLTPSPCTTPVIIAMITYTTLKGSVLLGGFLLLAYGLGHSIPFLVVGGLTGIFKHRGWMIRWHRLINKGLGITFIVIGFYFLFRDLVKMNM